MSVLIPLSQQPGQYVELFADDLPTEPEEVVDILRAELPPLSVWLAVALLYRRQGLVKNFESILENASSDDVQNNDAYRGAGLDKARVSLAYAAYLLLTSLNTPDTEEKQRLLNEATTLVNRHSTVACNMLWLTRALGGLVSTITFGPAELTKSKKTALMRSAFEFRQGGEVKGVDVLVDALLMSLLGRACAAFHLGEFDDARRLFADAIRRYPNCAPGVRNGLGVCLYMLEHFGAARAVFEHVCGLDPANEVATVALAVLADHSGDVRRSQELFSRDCAKRSPMALNSLARAYFDSWSRLDATGTVAHRGRVLTTSVDVSDKLWPGAPLWARGHVVHVETVIGTEVELTAEFSWRACSNVPLGYKSAESLERAVGLAQSAHMYTANPRVKAESLFVQACVYHVRGNLVDAHRLYEASLALWDGFQLARFGLGQTLAQRNRLEDAAAAFERVLADFPDDVDTLYALALVHLRRRKRKDALATLKRITDTHPQHSEAWLLQASLLQTDPGHAALHAYEKAVIALDEGDRAVPAAVYSNIAALEYREGHLERVKPVIDSAFRDIALHLGRDASDVDRGVWFSTEGVTPMYNLGRLREAEGRRHEAEAVYSDILKEYPAYHDATLRLACMARDSGDEVRARELLASVIDAPDGALEASADARVLLARMEHAKGNYEAALKLLGEVVSRRELRHDAYAHVTLGNIDYARATKGDRVDQRSLKSAFGQFQGTLEAHPGNVFAANGIATVLAENGKTDQARELLMLVREASLDTRELWVNLAHVCLVSGRVDDSIQMYANSLKKFNARCDAGLLLYLARAQFQGARIEEAIRTIAKAARAAPWDERLWYNLALCLNKEAVRALGLPPTQRTLAEVERAVMYLRQAASVCQQLLERDTGDVDSGKRFDKRMVEVIAKNCADNQTSCDAHLTYQRHLHAQEVADKRERASRRAEEERLEREAHEREEVLRRAEAHEREQRALKLMEEVKKWSGPQAEAQPSAKRAPKKKAPVRMEEEDVNEGFPEQEDTEEESVGGDRPAGSTRAITRRMSRQRQAAVASGAAEQRDVLHDEDAGDQAGNDLFGDNDEDDDAALLGRAGVLLEPDSGGGGGGAGGGDGGIVDTDELFRENDEGAGGDDDALLGIGGTEPTAGSEAIVDNESGREHAGDKRTAEHDQERPKKRQRTIDEDDEE